MMIYETFSLTLFFNDASIKNSKEVYFVPIMNRKGQRENAGTYTQL